jgi:hypothetical protein
MDLVYLCRRGENEELRYSLRSAAANLPHDRVWVFGGAPGWLTGATIVPTDQHAGKFVNAETSLRLACEHPDVSDPFVLMNDDFFVMQPVPQISALNFGPARSVLERYHGTGIKSGAYIERMEATVALLVARGFTDPLSYELHVPMVFSKAALLAVLDEFCLAAERTGIQYRSLYGNLEAVGGETIRDVKVYSRTQTVPQGPWLSSVDSAFDAIRPILAYLFAHQCRYEACVPASGDSRKSMRRRKFLGKGSAVGETVITQKRLYEETHGIRVLRFRAGARVPKDEYERLTGTKAPKQAETSRPSTTGPAASASEQAETPAEKPIERMNRTELLEYAAAHGVSVESDAIKREIIAAIQAQG